MKLCLNSPAERASAPALRKQKTELFLFCFIPRKHYTSLHPLMQSSQASEMDFSVTIQSFDYKITNSYLYRIKCKLFSFRECANVQMDCITHICIIMNSLCRLITQSLECAIVPFHIVKSLKLPKNSNIPTWINISYIYYLMCMVASKNVYKFVLL